MVLRTVRISMRPGSKVHHTHDLPLLEDHGDLFLTGPLNNRRAFLRSWSIRMITVDPRESALAMAAEWQALRICSSPALEAAWAWLCRTLNQAVTNTAAKPWTVAAMPTGTGKTQFAALYCARLQSIADQRGPLQSAIGHPGALFITPFTEEADQFVETVNRHIGRTIAAAFHSKSRLSAADAHSYPVLAITHEASSRHQLTATRETWKELTWWQHGQRQLTIFDEAPQLTVGAQVTTQDLSALLGSVSNLAGAPASKFEPLHRVLDQVRSRAVEMSKDRNMTPPEIASVQSADFDWLAHWVRTTDGSDLPFNEVGRVSDKRTQLLSVLDRLRFIAEAGWGWISISGKKATLSTSMMHPSIKSGRGVILDATASCNAAYQLLPERLRVLDVPAGVRKYDNVTVYASPGHNLGKDDLAKSVASGWSGILRSMREMAEPALTLACLNKVVEAAVVSRNSEVEGVALAHWGAINGRNHWRDHDAVALIGLPYLDRATPTNTVLGLIGPQSDGWMQSADEREYGKHADIVSAVHTGHVAGSLLQAINRVRCRKVVDKEGRCAPTSVFVMLPHGQAAEHLITSIVQGMPGVRVRDWDLNVTRRSSRRSRSFGMLLEHFKAAPVGLHERNAVQSELGLSATTVDRFIKRTSDQKSDEHAAMLRLNVAYHATTGRGAKAYFIKK